MTDSDIVELRLQVDEDDADAERVEQLISALLERLRELDIEFIDRAKTAEMAPGSKGEPLTTGAVIFGITAAAIPGLISLLQQWTGSSRKVLIEAPNGVKVEFTAKKRPSKEDVLEMIRELNKIDQ